MLIVKPNVTKLTADKARVRLYARHRLRLRDSDDAMRESAARILGDVVSEEQLANEVETILALAELRSPRMQPAHRALADAAEERTRWVAVRDAAASRAAALAAR